MDALTKRIVAEQKAARCASSSDESSDEREMENMWLRKSLSTTVLPLGHFTESPSSSYENLHTEVA
jgi:hypothetical protein